MNSFRVIFSCLLCAQFGLPIGTPSRPETEWQASEPTGAVRPDELPAPFQPDEETPLPDPTPAEEPLAPDTSAEDNDKFSFGRVLAIHMHSFVVREYDFARDCDVDALYWVTSESKFVNLPSLAHLAVDDGVVIDYIELAGERIVTTLVRELPDLRAGLHDAAGTVVAIEAGAVTLRHSRGESDAGELVRYVVTGDTELNNLSSVSELVPGDRVVLDYVEVAGLNGATSLSRIPGARSTSGDATAIECCLPCVVTSVDDFGVLFRVTNEQLAGVVPGGDLDDDVVLLNLASLKEIREGDLLDIVFSWVEGKWMVVGISRVDGP